MNMTKKERQERIDAWNAKQATKQKAWEALTPEVRDAITMAMEAASSINWMAVEAISGGFDFSPSIEDLINLEKAMSAFRELLIVQELPPYLRER